MRCGELTLIRASTYSDSPHARVPRSWKANTGTIMTMYHCHSCSADVQSRKMQASQFRRGTGGRRQRRKGLLTLKDDCRSNELTGYAHAPLQPVRPAERKSQRRRNETRAKSGERARQRQQSTHLP